MHTGSNHNSMGSSKARNTLHTTSVDLGCVFPLESSTTSSIQPPLDPGITVGSNGEVGSAVSVIVEGSDMAEELPVQALSAVEARVTDS